MQTAESFAPSQDDGSLKTQAQQKVAEVGEQAMEMASTAKQQAGSIITSKIDEGSSQLATKVRDQADMLRSLSEQLRQDGKQSQAQMLDRMCERASRVGDYLERADANTIISDVETVARRQPWLVAATAFGLGLIGSRIVRASSQQRSGDHLTRTQTDPFTGAAQPEVW